MADVGGGDTYAQPEHWAGPGVMSPANTVPNSSMQVSYWSRQWGLGWGDGESGMNREETCRREDRTDIGVPWLRDGSSVNHAEDGSENEEDG